MNTVSDVVAAAEVAAAAPNGPAASSDSAVGPPMGGFAHARARIAGTQRDGKGLRVVWADLRGAWPWTSVPPSLREVAATWWPSPDRVPGGARLLQVVWAVCNLAVALPTTAVLYTVAWIFQHPTRWILAAVIVGGLTYMWHPFG